MSLGNNRDYKTNSDRVTRHLKLHVELLAEFKKQGFSDAEADTKAYNLVIHPVRTLTEIAKDAIRGGVTERMFVDLTRTELQKHARKAYRAAKAEVVAK